MEQPGLAAVAVGMTTMSDPDNITSGWLWEGNTAVNIETRQRVSFDPVLGSFSSTVDGAFSIKAIPANVMLDLLVRWSWTTLGQTKAGDIFERMELSTWRRGAVLGLVRRANMRRDSLEDGELAELARLREKYGEPADGANPGAN